MAGLTPGEQAVMDLFEAGISPSDIASELRISPARARCIISTFDENLAQDRNREALIKRGSQTLLARLRKAGGHR